ncbi:rhomboid-5 isoform X2 [Lycorma delicatula]|uniref:rhomboid-5 isoform X2 n=1 Tax=Lycorma delicatula TaxID=130591 RepID=UPI003F518679
MQEVEARSNVRDQHCVGGGSSSSGSSISSSSASSSSTSSSNGSVRESCTGRGGGGYLAEHRAFLPPPPTPDRYLPPPAPAPPDPYDRYLLHNYIHDRYVPANIDRYDSYHQATTVAVPPIPGGPGDPYMRRDLGYHHHYRLPPTPAPVVPPSGTGICYFPSHQHHPQHHHHHQSPQSRVIVPSSQTTSRHQTGGGGNGGVGVGGGHLIPTRRCCPSTTPYHAHHTHHHHHHHHHQHQHQHHLQHQNHHSTSSSASSTSPLLSRTAAARQSAGSNGATAPPPVEYLGSSGGRYISTTPPLPRCNSVSDVHTANDLTVSQQSQHNRRLQHQLVNNSNTLCCPRRPQQILAAPQPSTPAQHNSVWRSVGQSPPSPTPPTTNAPPISPLPVPTTPVSMEPASPVPVPVAVPMTTYQRSVSLPVQEPMVQQSVSLPVETSTNTSIIQRRTLQHQQSMPVTQDEVVASRRRVYPTSSMTELVKNYIKRETAVFFGVHEGTEDSERARWLERRKRLCTRKYGQLRSEFQPLCPSTTAPSSTQPDVLPPGRDENDVSRSDAHLRRKPSVAKMTFSGVAYVVATLSRHKPRQSSLGRQMSRSYPPSTVPPSPTSPLDDEVFFDKASTTVNDSGIEQASSIAPPPSTDNTQWTAMSADITDSVEDPTRTRDRLGSWRRANPSERERPWEAGMGSFGLNRIHGRFLDTASDNSNRRQYGMGVVGRFFGRSLKRSVMSREPVRAQLEDLEDHRPFFTYWVTTVQALILLFSLWCYGLGPIGIHLTHQSGLVLVTSLSLQQVEYMEPANFWIGPRAADLIHLGAKFAPCMRKDAKIIKEIEKGREKERETACCIRNDDSGCVQSSKQDCSLARGLRPTKTISTWKKWSAGDSGPGGRLSGSVCGLDPKYCEAPASIAPYEWPDDITKWPICRKAYPPTQRLRAKDKLAAEHMVCEVIGHPCCIGIHGTCRITTREYCDFVHGYFHEEASLCSQVSCLDNVCGMIPFYSPEVPDQFYRLWTSLFLHAGVLHLAITLVIQWFLMRDLEKLTGSLRIMIIYMGSGVAGNLASAIFVPYRAEVGPAGAQFGLLACLIVEVLNAWPMLRHPQHALLKLLGINLVLFLFGLLPWVDNFAHLFGFAFGFLLSYALLPFVSFGEYDRQKKICLIWVCLMSSVFLFLLLVLLFYIIPVYDCTFCSYLTCLPLARDLCATQNINFKRDDSVV